jgi:F0F1-type ATP synthase assembly protein I
MIHETNGMVIKYRFGTGRGPVEKGLQELRAAGIRVLEEGGLPAAAHAENLSEHLFKGQPGLAAGIAAGVLVGGALGWLTMQGVSSAPGSAPFLVAGTIMGSVAGAIAGAPAGIFLATLLTKRKDSNVPSASRIPDAEGIVVSVACEDADSVTLATDILERAGGKQLPSVQARYSPAVEEVVPT